MSYREIDMIELKEILLRLAKGESKKGISRSLGIHRKTIKRYVKLSRYFGVDPARDGAQAITSALIGKIKEKESNDKRTTLCTSKQLLLSVKPRIEKHLEDGLTGTKILQFIRRDGIEVTEASFYRFLRNNCSTWIKRKITVRLPETAPGDYAQCDFGRLGKIYDDGKGKERIVYAFIITLCFSRHQYVHVSFKQDSETVIKGCEAAFGYWKGIPRRLIFDNMKPIITKYDRYNPAINRSFLEYSQYRGFTVDPAPARKATGKPQVERAVPYVRGNFFAGEKFINIDDVQERAIEWCSNVAGSRVHQTTYQKPIEVFEKIEKKELMPYDGQRYDIPFWGECKVHPDHHIRFLKSLYSVPTQYIDKKRVLVRGDSALVKIYFNGKLIKVHNRVGEGKRSTDFNDYPEKLTPYTLRNPNYQIQEGYKRNAAIGLYIKSMLDGAYPWYRIRSAQKLLRLSDKYGSERVGKACERFQMYGVYNVTRIERMLIKSGEQAPLPKPEQEASSEVKPARFERAANSFNHNKL